MRELPWVTIGSFELSGPRLVVSDPCYPRPGSRRQGGVVAARPGAWTVSAVFNRSCCLAVEAVFARASRKDKLPWAEADFPGNVDSGQFGFFDEPFHRPDDKAWYARCCKATSSYPFVGVLAGGAVASSGYGDGGYPVFLVRDRIDLVIGVRVLFCDPAEFCYTRGRRR